MSVTRNQPDPSSANGNDPVRLGIATLRHEARRYRNWAIEGLLGECHGQGLMGIRKAAVLDAAADFLEGEKTWYECYVEEDR